MHCGLQQRTDKMNIDTLYEDDDILIVNKPAGLLVVPDRFNALLPSLNKILEKKAGQKMWVVHRLDRDTSGVICFAKNEEAHRYLSILFQERDVSKFYAGLVIGIVTPGQDRIEGYITEHPAGNGRMMVAKRGKLAVTDYKVSNGRCTRCCSSRYIPAAPTRYAYTCAP